MNDSGTSNVYTGETARGLLARGVNEVADAVKVTLGSKGSNAVLEEQVYPGHIVTNDGISIAMKVKMEHPVEQMGANIMREIADRSNRESGDGTTTSMVLAQAILKAGMDAGVHTIEVKKSMDLCMPIIEAAIDGQKRIITEQEVAAVATISAEDPALGAMIQEIFEKIGKDGIIELDNSGGFDTTYEVKEGVRLRNAGYMGPYMANSGTQAVYENPRILIAKQRISTLQDIDPLFRTLSAKGINELVIFCDDIDGSVLNALAYTHVKGIFKTLIIQAPKLWKDWLFEDFAKITGATVVEPASGISWKNLNLTHIGTCGKLITTRDETMVIGIQDISEHIKLIETEGTDESKLRLSWLNTKAAILKIGASSETELSYKRLKAEDARNAAWLALQDGVVPGGGVALLQASKNLPDTIGGRILKEALKAPILQIAKNAGNEVDFIEMLNGSEGFDSATGTIRDMWEANIIDPAKVVKNAVRNAISVAGTVLTIETVTTTPKV